MHVPPLEVSFQPRARSVDDKNTWVQLRHANKTAVEPQREIPGCIQAHCATLRVTTGKHVVRGGIVDISSHVVVFQPKLEMVPNAIRSFSKKRVLASEKERHVYSSTSTPDIISQ